MDEEYIPLEPTDKQRQRVQARPVKGSLISAIQRNIVEVLPYLRQMNEMNELEDSRRKESIMTTTPQNIHKSLSSSSAYFREDSGEISIHQSDLLSSKYKAKPHEVHLRGWKFINYFLVRLIFYIVGPLINLPGLFSLQWRNFMTNFGMSFWVPQKSMFYNYGRLALNYVLIYLFLTDDQTFTKHLYYFILFTMSILLELVTYSVKYAFFHPMKLEMIETLDITDAKDSYEKSINPQLWMMQPGFLIVDELESSIQRLQIEQSSFMMFFMAMPKEDLRDRIEHHKKHVNHYAGSCFLMAKEVIEYFNTHNPISYYMGINLLMSLVRVCITIIIEMYFDYDNTALGIVSKVLQFFYFIGVLSMTLIALRDLQRRVFCMTQLSHLISGQKVEAYEETKLFPTLNLICINSLLSWVNLRKLFLDYGLQYTERSTYTLSFTILFNGVVMFVATIFCYLQYIDLMNYGMLCVDFILISILIIFVVLQGARINDHSGIHKGLIRKNLFLIQQLSVQAFLDVDYKFTPKDFVFKALSDVITNIKTGDIIKEDQFQAYIVFVLTSLENVYNDLTFQEQHQQFTVLGIAMNYQLLLQVVLSVGGLLASALTNLLLNI